MIITDYDLFSFCKITCNTCNISALLTAYSQSKATQINPPPLTPHQSTFAQTPSPSKRGGGGLNLDEGGGRSTDGGCKSETPSPKVYQKIPH